MGGWPSHSFSGSPTTHCSFPSNFYYPTSLFCCCCTKINLSATINLLSTEFIGWQRAATEDHVFAPSCSFAATSFRVVSSRVYPAESLKRSSMSSWFIHSLIYCTESRILRPGDNLLVLPPNSLLAVWGSFAGAGVYGKSSGSGGKGITAERWLNNNLSVSACDYVIKWIRGLEIKTHIITRIPSKLSHRSIWLRRYKWLSPLPLLLLFSFQHCPAQDNLWQRTRVLAAHLIGPRSNLWNFFILLLLLLLQLGLWSLYVCRIWIFVGPFSSRPFGAGVGSEVLNAINYERTES